MLDMGLTETPRGNQSLVPARSFRGEHGIRRIGLPRQGMLTTTTQMGGNDTRFENETDVVFDACYHTREVLNLVFAELLFF